MVGPVRVTSNAVQGTVTQCLKDVETGDGYGGQEGNDKEVALHKLKFGHFCLNQSKIKCR